MITITLNQIRKYKPCAEGWETLLKFQGKKKADDAPFPFSDLLESNGVDDALWALRCIDDSHPTKLLAVAFAQEVLDLMENQRSKDAVKIAHLFLHGEVTKKELREAADDAWSATDIAAYAAAYVGNAAWNTASAAAYAATYAADSTAYAAYAATVAANAAAAAYAATYAAADATHANAAYETMREKQAEWIKIIMDNWE